MSDVYKNLFDARKLLTPEDQDYDIKTKAQPLKNIEALDPKNPPRILRIYTDGSSLVSKTNNTNPTFSGWGYFIIGFKNGSQRNLRKNSGFILDGTPLLAELEAIKHGLEYVDRPTCVSLVTDSTYAIKELKDMKTAYGRLESLRSEGIKTDQDRIRLRTLQTLVDIDKLAQSKNISALEVSWQPSHTIDRADVSIDDLRSAMEAEQDSDKRMFLLDVYGNEMADKRAGKGSRKAVKVAIEDIQRQESRLRAKGMLGLAGDFLDRDKVTPPEDIIKKYGKPSFDTLMKYTKGLRKSAKLFFGSRTAREVAIDLIAKQDRDYMSDQAMSILFSENDKRMIFSRIGSEDSGKSSPRSIIRSVAEKLESNQNSEKTCLKSSAKPDEWAKERDLGDNAKNETRNKFSESSVKID